MAYLLIGCAVLLITVICFPPNFCFDKHPHRTAFRDQIGDHNPVNRVWDCRNRQYAAYSEELLKMRGYLDDRID